MPKGGRYAPYRVAPGCRRARVPLVAGAFTRSTQAGPTHAGFDRR